MILLFSLEFLETLTVDGVQRADAEHLKEVMTVVIWFLAICSIDVIDLSRLFMGFQFLWGS
ncbi:hypothetical protein M7I_1057 [Glarea lozoyensis 74030]|uniref:Uncharacterized protein n=1 Tax=Glarea lozoyensis (strain ATCC 74030 / MF5533) TaxID=1104152 RepID=H0EF19_GLAL7|nr:hypothetical protein M7I_1057 [Glarea lozoyensis 74030]